MPAKAYICAFLIFLFGTSCVQTPSSPQPVGGGINQGVFILCEGIWGYDNPALAYFDFSDKRLHDDIFNEKNQGQKVGDTANDLFRKGDTAFIVVSSGGYVRAVDLRTATDLGKIEFPGAKALRKMCLANDSTALVTDLYTDRIFIFDPRTLMAKPITIGTGKGPEGIVRSGDRIFVANSGFGDYGQDHPTAGTIWVYDASSVSMTASFYCGPNVTELAVDEAGNLVAAYKHTPANRAKDSLGGIAVFDSKTFERKLHFRTNVEKILPHSSHIYFVNQEGLFRSDYQQNRELLYANPDKSQFWYALDFSPADGSAWIANARNYTVSGEIIVLDKQMKSVIRRFDTGVNPNTFLFYPY